MSGTVFSALGLISSPRTLLMLSRAFDALALGFERVRASIYAVLKPMTAMARECHSDTSKTGTSSGLSAIQRRIPTLVLEAVGGAISL